MKKKFAEFTAVFMLLKIIAVIFILFSCVLLAVIVNFFTQQSIFELHNCYCLKL